MMRRIDYHAHGFMSYDMPMLDSAFNSDECELLDIAFDEEDFALLDAHETSYEDTPETIETITHH